MTRALWAIISGDGLSVATGMICELGKARPDWQAEAGAFAAFLNASYDRMPSNLDEILNGLTSRQPTSGVLPVIRGMLELYRFEAQAALVALDSAEGFDLVANVEPFVRGLALLVAGRSDHSGRIPGHSHAPEHRDQAVPDHDLPEGKFHGPEQLQVRRAGDRQSSARDCFAEYQRGSGVEDREEPPNEHAGRVMTERAIAENGHRPV
jgi:hypothetical protein